MALVYATVDDFEADPRLSGWTTTDEPALTKALEAAERDIDSYLGPWPVQSNGRKMGAPAGANEAGLSATQKMALRDATIAQAYYRIQRGPEFFFADQHESVSGPDFSTSGKLSNVSPAAKRDLAGSGLVIRTAQLA